MRSTTEKSKQHGASGTTYGGDGMNNIANANIEGRVADDPVRIEKKDGRLLVVLNIAVFRDGCESVFVVETVGSLALKAEATIKKGDFVFVTGAIRQEEHGKACVEAQEIRVGCPCHDNSESE